MTYHGIMKVYYLPWIYDGMTYHGIMVVCLTMALDFNCFKFLGYPNEKAARVALKTIRSFLDENKDWVCNRVVQ